MIIAKNYWDEMGDGHPELIHTELFDKSVKFMKEHLKSVGIDPSDIDFEEIYSNAAILLMYGLRRWFVPRLIGALGILEETASQRFLAMVDGCNRLGVPKDVIQYQEMHVSVDHDHGRDWFDGVLKPLVHESKDLMEEICKGVLIRHNIAGDYYNKLYDFLKRKQYQRVLMNEQIKGMSNNPTKN
ncbi:iron-containing redox enzyme family protein [Nostoc sp. XA010]|nr:iron-containing redox enzyme family protein [Nostoc sp. XA010]MCC5662159.1 iron-containing redox enzyme family protein [Nostoc sp. XA010]